MDSIRRIFVLLFVIQSGFIVANANLPPTFTQTIDLKTVNENTPIGTSIYKLVANDPENSPISYGITGTSLFKVDRHSGTVTVAQQLDREVIGDSVKFFVSAEDIVDGGRSAAGNNKVTVPVTILLIDENDNPPEFHVKNRDVQVREDVLPGTVILDDIFVTDKDMVGDILQVTCDCGESFAVEIRDEPTNSRVVFALRIREPVEYDPRKSRLTLSLIAFDGIHNSTLPINVEVTDVQNRPPVFIGSTTAIIPEDASIGTTVIHIKAIDGDVLSKGIPSPSSRSGRRVRYELLNNPGEYFDLDPVTGMLKVANRMDKESFPSTNGVISLKIRAIELKNDGDDDDEPIETRTAITTITVTLQDVNDEPPTFNKKNFAVTVEENAPNGTPLANLDMFVSDADSGSNSVFNIALIDPSGVFAVEPPLATGSTSVSIKVTNGPLDYENPNQRKFILQVVATEAFTKEKLSSTATVTVTVTDQNDNKPQFESSIYSATVVEDAMPGTVVTSITAADRDSGTVLMYSVFGNGAELFDVNPTTGLVTVAYCESPGRGNCIDYETRTQYYLSYQASDGQGQSTVVPFSIQVLDSNDNPPHFLRESYTAIIDEGAEKFDPPLKVRATDFDVTSVITYSIVAGNPGNLFSIEPRSGEIKPLRPVRVDQDMITLTVQASDSGKGVASIPVYIKIRDSNDNAPQFLKASYLASISESAGPGTFVDQVQASDEDSGQNANVTYRIQRGAFDDFVIDPLTGVISVSKSARLDFDRRSIYEIEITATDSGVPPKMGTTTLTIHIINHNDKSPYFTPTTQRAEISEAAPINTLVHEMKAHDPDVLIPDSLRYAVESVTAIDKNGQPVPYSATRNFLDFFSVDPKSGHVFVSSKLNRDVAAIVTLSMSVKDMSASPPQFGLGSLIITLVAHNDDPPVFSKPWTPDRPELNYFLLEEQPAGTVVATLLASDQDSKISRYEIQPESDYFAVDADSGVVTLKKTIDYEEFEEDPQGRVVLKFNVFAYDSGVPVLSAMAIVSVNVININDHSPVFNATSYKAEIRENSAWGTHVITVKATDRDSGAFGKVTYKLLNGDENFVIDSHSGEIKVASGAEMDREKQRSTRTLQVAAVDGAGKQDARMISVPVYVTLIDVNDNPPAFTHREYEATAVGKPDTHEAPVITVSATDPDEGPHGKIAYQIVAGDSKGVFGIDRETGLISTVKPPSKVNPDIKEYKLKVVARDMDGQGPFFDEALVKIKIMDLNKHKPVFLAPYGQVVTVPENLPAGIKVVQIEARDEDEGENGQIVYSFKINNENKEETEEFSIDPYLGIIKTRKPLDREAQSKYQLVLAATDEGRPQSFETLHKLTIVVKDVDDNEPQFRRSEYAFTVRENEIRGLVVGRLEATDADEGPSSIYYYIIDGNEDRAFYLDEKNGHLYSNISFDRESKATYNLIVKASSDAKPPAIPPTSAPGSQPMKMLKDDASMASIQVTVLDVNDNQPTFEKPVYSCGVHYKSDIGTVVVSTKAIDEDEGANATLTYHLTGVDLYRKGFDEDGEDLSKTPVRPIPSPFIIGQDGRITTTQLMSAYPIGSRFVLHIEAREVSQPHGVAQSKVYIWVYEPHKQIIVTMGLSPEQVYSQKDEIEDVFSKASHGVAIINEIKYHVEPRSGIVRKDMSDVSFLMVDGLNEVLPAKVIERLDASEELHEREASMPIRRIVLASQMDEILVSGTDPMTIVFIVMIVLLVIGFIVSLVSCLCLKSWYEIQYVKKTMKEMARASRAASLAAEAEMNSIRCPSEPLATISRSKKPPHHRQLQPPTPTGTPNVTGNPNGEDNPLWTEAKAPGSGAANTLPNMYEEQELSMSVAPPLNQSGHSGQNGFLQNAQFDNGSDIQFFDPHGDLYASLATGNQHDAAKARQRHAYLYEAHEYHEVSDDQFTSNGPNGLDTQNSSGPMNSSQHDAHGQSAMLMGQSQSSNEPQLVAHLM